MRSMRLFIGSILLLAAVVAGLITYRERQRIRTELVVARQEMAAGRHSSARARLVKLASSAADWDEVWYDLGLCEQARSRPEAALTAWQHISHRSDFAPQVNLATARILFDSQRFSEAESRLAAIPRDSGPLADEARNLLVGLYQTEGRIDEVGPLILEGWERAVDPSELLRRHFVLETAPFPIDFVRRALGSQPTDDDRVWLGKANLAQWTGRFDEAESWLQACLRKRVDDPAVNRARLRLAQAKDDTRGFQRASEHLPAAQFSEADVLSMRAWLAARRGDARLERHCLQSVIAVAPRAIAAWDRLAELALEAGNTDEAQQLRMKRASLNNDRERYRTLILREDRAAHSAELAVLAERLGRSIEFRGWSLIKQGKSGSSPLERPGADSARAPTGQPTLASRLVDLFPATDRATSASTLANLVSSPTMSDEAQAAGLHFLHENGQSTGELPPVLPMSGGVALLDFDNDGWLDVYVVQGGPFPPPVHSRQGDRLFRNRGGGVFEDVTERSGIAAFPGGYGHGVTVGDYDSDGYPDLFVSRWQSYALYRNRGDGRFEDVTARAGLGGSRDWPTSAAFADLDGDGDLDLYVCHYLAYDPEHPPPCQNPAPPARPGCDPIDFPSLPDHVFRNDFGRFIEVTAEAGFSDPAGRGLGVVAADLDDDGRIDLYVANDMSANYLFRNQGGFRFAESGQLAGAAASADGGFKAGMGVACGDLDGDGRVDLVVTNFFAESTTFFHNLGGGFFADHSSNVGLTGVTRPLLGFGIAFLDVENDGWLDLLSANGHIRDGRPRFPFRMPLQLLRGSPGGHLRDVSATAGAAFTALRLCRGLAVGDLDNDGRIDAVVIAQNEPLLYLHNTTQEAGHFIRFRLEGTRSNRDGIGTRVTITANNRLQTAQRTGGGSYQSASDPRLHFGLGKADRVTIVEVRWPSGQVDLYHDLPAGREYVLREKTSK